MLIKFAVKNFRGFAERIEWHLSHPSNYEFNKYAIKDGIIKKWYNLWSQWVRKIQFCISNLRHRKSSFYKKGKDGLLFWMRYGNTTRLRKEKSKFNSLKGWETLVLYYKKENEKWLLEK